MYRITTYTKIHFSPVQAEARHIEIADIAHALSLLCRANGHIRHFFSVAQHCLNCAEEAHARGYSRRVQLFCLLHDASEAYISDVTRPVKAGLPAYREMEARLQAVIDTRFLGAPPSEEERRQIDSVDDAMLYAEFRELMGELPFETPPETHSRPCHDREEFSQVERRFLEAFHNLAVPEETP